MSFLDKTGLARLWANILSLVDRVVPQKVDEVFEETEFILDCSTAADYLDGNE